MLIICLIKNVVFIPGSLVIAVKDDILSKSVPILLHHTVKELLENLEILNKLFQNFIKFWRKFNERYLAYKFRILKLYKII